MGDIVGGWNEIDISLEKGIGIGSPRHGVWCRSKDETCTGGIETDGEEPGQGIDIGVVPETVHMEVCGST